MSKVYLLREWPVTLSTLGEPTNIGIISKDSIAENWSESDKNYTGLNRTYQVFELDNPELLNRIAKEGK